MLTLKEPIKARKTCIGHYDFHYPDTEKTGVVLKPGTKIILLGWRPSDRLRAITVRENDKTVVYWVDPDDITYKCA